MRWLNEDKLLIEPANGMGLAAPKEKMMKNNVTLGLGLLAFALTPAFAQTPAPTGTIHGHVTDPTGVSRKNGSISLSNDGGHTSKYTFQVDANGDYKGEATPGTYTLVFRQPDTPPDKMIDSIDNIKIVVGTDVMADDDMSRKEFVDKLPEETKKQLEEVRKHNSEAMKANAVIKNINNDLRQVGQDFKDAETAHAAAVAALPGGSKADIDAKEAEIKKAKYEDAESLMLKDTSAKADASILWAQLGQAQADLKKYDDATASFNKALDLEKVAKKANPQIQAMASAGLGEIYARTGKATEAAAAYDDAAKADPTKAGFYLKNEAVVFFQLGNADAQAAAADKAIAIDPTQAILYYLKGNALIGKTTQDPQTKKLVPPAGCMEAYQKYIELAPTGTYAAEVQGIMAGFNQKIESTYKEAKKKK